LSLTLAAHVVEAAPVGLATTITSTAVSTVALTSPTPTIVLHIMASLKSKIALVALLAGGVATPLIIQRTAMSRLRVENESLQARLASAQAIQPSPQTNISNFMEPASPTAQEAELLRLRGEVTRLRADAARTRRASAAQSNTGPQSGQTELVGGYEMYT